MLDMKKGGGWKNPLPNGGGTGPRRMIFEVEKGVVNKKVAGRQGVEDIKVGVLDPRAIEVRGRKGSSMKGGGIFVIPLVSHFYKVSVFPNTSIANIPSCFHMSLFVEEETRVEVGLSSIIPYPPFTRVIRVLEVTSKRGGKTNGF